VWYAVRRTGDVRWQTWNRQFPNWTAHSRWETQARPPRLRFKTKNTTGIRDRRKSQMNEKEISIEIEELEERTAPDSSASYLD
jgi:hypothetical protein